MSYPHVSPRDLTRFQTPVPRDNQVVIHRLTVTAALLAAAYGADTSRDSIEVGQRWVYRHEGPRPGSAEPNAIGGQRIRWVISLEQWQDRHRWIAEERFTNDTKIIGRLCVNREGSLEALESANDEGEAVLRRYDAPIPYQPMGMAVGETRTISTTVRVDSANFALPSTTVSERLADETVTTPAGDFTDCSHYRSTTTSTINIKIAKVPVTEQREQWYHPAAQGMVKEVYRRGPVKFLAWSRPGYTATSVLTAYDRQERRRIEPSQDPNAPMGPVT